MHTEPLELEVHSPPSRRDVGRNNIKPFCFPRSGINACPLDFRNFQRPCIVHTTVANDATHMGFGVISHSKTYALTEMATNEIKARFAKALT